MTTTTLASSILLSNDLLTGAEWSPSHTHDLLRLTADIKANPGRYAKTLHGKFIALIFEKPSLPHARHFRSWHSVHGRLGRFSRPYPSPTRRTRIHRRCSAQPRALGARHRRPCLRTACAGRKWPPAAAYIPRHQRAAYRDRFHPCQALADFFTLEEKVGDLRGFKLAYIGDGNNVCHSLIFLAARLGVHLRIATPPDYAPDRDVLQDSRRVAKETRAKIELVTDPREAVAGVDAVYTDSWTSMGFEAQQKVRNSVFTPYQVNAALMALAAPNAFFMHCLPAHRECEVTSEVLDGPQSVVLDQSENRMYVQKAILHTLFS